MFGIGMRLRLMPTWHFPREMALLAGAKFLLLPGLTLGGLWLAARSPWGIDPLLRDVLTIEAFVPTALLSVMLANLFHLDTRLAAHLWLWNTILFLAGPAVVLILWYT